MTGKEGQFAPGYQGFLTRLKINRADGKTGPAFNTSTASSSHDKLLYPGPGKDFTFGHDQL